MKVIKSFLALTTTLAVLLHAEVAVGQEEDTHSSSPLTVLRELQTRGVADRVTTGWVNKACVSNKKCLPKGNRSVCGVDGETYYNRCTLNCGRTEYKSEGACESNAAKPPTSLKKTTVPLNKKCIRKKKCNSKREKPVCGADGHTYKNPCTLKCGYTKFDHKGKCKTSPIDTVTTGRVDKSCVEDKECLPKGNRSVCGVNRETYYNRCTLNCGYTEYAYEGACRAPTPAPTPVASCVDSCGSGGRISCGMNGITYDNLCRLRCDNTELRFYGPCPAPTPEPTPMNACYKACGSSGPEVCATNGITYDNICQMRCDWAQYKYNGPCKPPTPAPTPAPTPVPVSSDCVNPKTVPNRCEVGLLMELMDEVIQEDDEGKALPAQWLRLAFHDAGTFNKQVNEGGANGCLMTDPDFVNAGENNMLNLAVDPLIELKEQWEGLEHTCVKVSNADMIQFAGYFASVRQRGVPGLTDAKRNEMKHGLFRWGRPDEMSCKIKWVENLPGFHEEGAPLDGVSALNIVGRCTAAGGEIKKKMMDRNGFTAREATALIGAHTIGLTRFAFTAPDKGPWVENGRDDATPNGPVFDNGFHSFLFNEVEAPTLTGSNGFGGGGFGNNIPNRKVFNVDFPSWFQHNLNVNGNPPDPRANFLDTDVVLKYPSENLSKHPNFHLYTEAFANDNALFLETFEKALDKMSKLGVDVQLKQASTGPCPTPSTGRRLDIAKRAAGSISKTELVTFRRVMNTAITKALQIIERKRNANRAEIEALSTPLEDIC